jgi:acyl carrier protein
MPDTSVDSVESTLRDMLAVDLYLDVAADQIGLDDGLRDVLGLDSLGYVELRALCESRFGITISDTEFSPANFRSVRTVAELIRRLEKASYGG